jgi:hypothetical protein
MPDLRPPFRAAHLVMWSSPLLLLILVFTLTNASSTPTSSPTTLSATTGSTLLLPSTTTTAVSAPRTTLPSTRAGATTTSAPNVVPPSEPYATTTSSIVKSIALAPSASASNGALAGTLSAAQPVVDIPLEGPGSWSITTSAPALEVLACNGANRSVATQFSISGRQSCQLVITSTVREVQPSWRLTPTP